MLVVAFGMAALTNANLPLVAEQFDVFTPLTIKWIACLERAEFGQFGCALSKRMTIDGRQQRQERNREVPWLRFEWDKNQADDRI
jgi:hypothetical protein